MAKLKDAGLEADASSVTTNSSHSLVDVTIPSALQSATQITIAFNMRADADSRYFYATPYNSASSSNVRYNSHGRFHRTTTATPQYFVNYIGDLRLHPELLGTATAEQGGHGTITILRNNQYNSNAVAFQILFAGHNRSNYSIQATIQGTTAYNEPYPDVWRFKTSGGLSYSNIKLYSIFE